MADFEAQVSDWVERVKVAHEAVFRKSVERVVEEMLKPRAAGGNMPIDTGFLRASVVASNSEMPRLKDGSVPEEGATYQPDGTVALVIAATEIGEELYIGFTAAYAARMNYGFAGEDKLGRSYSQQGYLFVELAAQKWQEIVAKTEAELVALMGVA